MGFEMWTKSVLRDSLIVFAMVVLAAYSAALFLNLFLGVAPSNQATVQTILAALSVLAVIGLGFVLWRSERDSGP
ncbi:MAG TPA: hypothetical protein VIL58_03690 [Thermoplasmata archaeon]